MGTRDPAAPASDMGNGRLWVVRRPLRDGRYATERLGATGKGMGLAAECRVRRQQGAILGRWAARRGRASGRAPVL